MTVNTAEKMAHRLPTVPARSTFFFIAIVTAPFAIALPLVAWNSILAWAFVVLGLLPMLECLRELRVSYYVDAVGISRRRMLGRDVLPWKDVEAIGTRTIREKYEPNSIMFIVYSAGSVFRFTQRASDADHFIRRASQHCPALVLIDEESAVLEAPHGGKSARVDALIAAHARRLWIKNTIGIYVSPLVLVPLVILVVHDFIAGTMGRHDVVAAVFGIGFCATFLSGCFQARRYLRRRGLHR